MKQGKRIFVYGLQSSGASLFTYFLGQIPEVVTVVDLWSHCVAPSLQTRKDVILKATINTEIRLSNHIAQFMPTHKILFVRHPIQNYLSLDIKHYRNWRGPAEEKFGLADSIYEKKRDYFDLIVYFEEFISRPHKAISDLRNIGLLIDSWALSFSRTRQQIIESNMKYSIWCRRNFEKQWGFGNIHFDSLGTFAPRLYQPSMETERLLCSLCPCIMNFYAENKISDLRC